jgi:hypothetical protein
LPMVVPDASRSRHVAFLKQSCGFSTQVRNGICSRKAIPNSPDQVALTWALSQTDPTGLLRYDFVGCPPNSTRCVVRIVGKFCCPTYKAGSGSADRGPSSHPLPHRCRIREGAAVRHSVSFRAIVVLWKTLAHRARGDATRRTGSGQLELGAAEIVRTPGLASTLQATPETLNSAIRLLTADPVLARSMGEAGRWHAEAHFSWDALPRWKICTKASVVQ